LTGRWIDRTDDARVRCSSPATGVNELNRAVLDVERRQAEFADMVGDGRLVTAGGVSA
jgi:hypothetical protein